MPGEVEATIADTQWRPHETVQRVSRHSVLLWSCFFNARIQGADVKLRLVGMPRYPHTQSAPRQVTAPSFFKQRPWVSARTLHLPRGSECVPTSAQATVCPHQPGVAELSGADAATLATVPALQGSSSIAPLIPSILLHILSLRKPFWEVRNVVNDPYFLGIPNVRFTDCRPCPSF